MLLNYILLALSVSIDSISIGVTYGIKKIKISKISNFILWIISFFIAFMSMFLGHIISLFLPNNCTSLLGSIFLIMLGVYNLFKCSKNKINNYDLDNSNYIDIKEAFYLGLALSIDSICVSIGCGSIGVDNILLPILIASFQLVFLNCGNYIINSIISKINLPDKYLAIFSSIILIIIGISKIIFI